MAKNIVICCDGTNNQFKGAQTNVVRMAKVAARSPDQIVFYDPGVGTMSEAWFRTNLGRWWSKVRGLAFASGFTDNVLDVYHILMDEYEPGDKVFLFGFSRGAFTARSVAAMIQAVGLLQKHNDNLLRYAVDYWLKDFRDNPEGMRVCADFKRTFSRECRIHFIGVWDTVSSVGFINHFTEVPHTHHNRCVDHVRHAVSIDERRCCFCENTMGLASDNQDVKNVWFPGVHADVGGGYGADEDQLAKIAFEWILREARAVGLEVNETLVPQVLQEGGLGPDCMGQLHDSMTLPWRFLEIIPTRWYSIGDERYHWRFAPARLRDVISGKGKTYISVHESVLRKMRFGDYRPKNLPLTPEEIEASFMIER